MIENDFHFQTSDGRAFILRVEHLADGVLGDCDSDSHTIRISPRDSGEEVADTLIHEFLHAEFSTWKHPRIEAFAAVLARHLRVLGYSFIPSEGDQMELGMFIDGMAQVLIPECDGPAVARFSEALAAYLHTAGLRKGSANGRQGSGSPRPRARCAGRGKRGKKLGFDPSKGDASA